MMKALNLPLFILRLVWKNLVNFVQLVFFYFSTNKLVAVNALLTLLIVGLGIAWRILPSPQPIIPPKIKLAIENSREIIPIYFAWDQTKIAEEFFNYQEKVFQQEFTSQIDYLNLATLAQADGKYGQANEYLELAKNIDPNRDFFVK